MTLGRPPVRTTPETEDDPTVRPASETGAVRDRLAALIPDVAACWHEVDGQSASRAGSYYFRLEVGAGGQAVNVPPPMLKRVDPAIADCLTEVVQSADFSGVSVGTAVHWPVVLDPEQGVSLR